MSLSGIVMDWRYGGIDRSDDPRLRGVVSFQRIFRHCEGYFAERRRVLLPAEQNDGGS